MLPNRAKRRSEAHSQKEKEKKTCQPPPPPRVATASGDGARAGANPKEFKNAVRVWTGRVAFVLTSMLARAPPRSFFLKRFFCGRVLASRRIGARPRFGAPFPPEHSRAVWRRAQARRGARVPNSPSARFIRSLSNEGMRGNLRGIRTLKCDLPRETTAGAHLGEFEDPFARALRGSKNSSARARARADA